MARFLLTLNMPANSGALVQNVIVDREEKTVKDFVHTLNHCSFIVVRLWYRHRNENSWEDRGDQGLNCAVVGKVALYVDKNGERD